MLISSPLPITSFTFRFALLFLLSVAGVGAHTTAMPLPWSSSQINTISRFSFKHIPELSSDPSNQYLHNQDAIRLGRDLFNDARMSANGKVACASCHIKAMDFTDRRNVALGVRIGVRNTPSLLNAAEQNWFFWDGRKDSLWAQAMGPLENPNEHAFTRLEVLRFITTDKHYRKRYQSIFKQALPNVAALAKLPAAASPQGTLDELIAWKKLPRSTKKQINRVFANIGKAIAAYVSTLKHKPARFDRFVNELLEKGSSAVLDESEQRGLALFIGRAGCANCHSGPLFSNKEFHNIGTGIPGVDNGRAEVINEVLHDEFNCLGEYSDASPDQCMELKYMSTDRHALAGAYKTPLLRNVAHTAPYMHDGRFSSLEDVLGYYAAIDKNRAAQTDLPVIKLSKQDQADLLAFLKTL